MWFATREEQTKAIRELPIRPPEGTRDLDAWRNEINMRTQEIMEATIGGESPESKQPPVVAPTVTDPEPAAPVSAEPLAAVSGLSDDDEILIKVKRKELPPNLQKYRDGNAILTTAAHARSYADQTEQKYLDLQRELEQVRREREEKASQIESLRKAAEQVKAQSAATPQTHAQRIESDAKIARLESAMNLLDDIDESDLVDGGRLKKALTAVVSELGSLKERNRILEGQLSSTKSDLVQELTAVKTSYTAMTEAQKKEEERRLQAERERAAAQEIAELQAKYAEDLGTSKQAFGQGDTMETSIAKLTDRVCMAYGVPAGDWSMRNRVLSGMLNGAPDVEKVCRENGIQFADVGITENDATNWLLLVQANHAKNGMKLDKDGRWVQDVDTFGQVRKYPTAESAYLEMASRSGLLRAREEQRIIEAEKNGQKSLSEAMSRRDTKVLGPTDGTPSEIGQAMTEDAAKEVFGMVRGPGTIDQTKMELALRAGDPQGWEMFELYTRACERLGVDRPMPNPIWRRPVPAAVR